MLCDVVRCCVMLLMMRDVWCVMLCDIVWCDVIYDVMRDVVMCDVWCVVMLCHGRDLVEERRTKSFVVDDATGEYADTGEEVCVCVWICCYWRGVVVCLEVCMWINWYWWRGVCGWYWWRGVCVCMNMLILVKRCVYIYDIGGVWLCRGVCVNVRGGNGEVCEQINRNINHFIFYICDSFHFYSPVSVCGCPPQLSQTTEYINEWINTNASWSSHHDHHIMIITSWSSHQ